LASIANRADEAVVDGVAGSLLAARDRRRQPDEGSESLTVDRLDRGQLRVCSRVAPHTQTISSGVEVFSRDARDLAVA
jgi:hypothetical protein